MQSVLIAGEYEVAVANIEENLQLSISILYIYT